MVVTRVGSPVLSDRAARLRAAGFDRPRTGSNTELAGAIGPATSSAFDWTKPSLCRTEHAVRLEVWHGRAIGVANIVAGDNLRADREPTGVGLE